MTLRVAYIGNFEPEHSTENDLRRTMEGMGVEVTCYQEGTRDALSAVDQLARPGSPIDVVLWTSTKGLADKWPEHEQRFLLYDLRRHGIPTVAVHLDRWWGLGRELNVLSEPWFRCEYVFTADGDHQDNFAAAGVNHHWSPPAIAPHNAHIGTFNREMKSDLAFVGNHFAGHYHAEWTHRQELVKWLNRHYRGRCAFYPRVGPRGAIEPAVRGEALNDLYASVKVVVGDSCLVPNLSGAPMRNYCSDRVFETIGRGGLLIHPYVDGIIGPPGSNSALEADVHCLAWELGDWNGLQRQIERVLAEPEETERIRTAGFQWVGLFHTYAQRLDEIFDTVLGRGWEG